MAEIQRFHGKNAGRSRASATENLVFAVATAPDTNAGVADQTRQALREIDATLSETGTDKSRILSATIYMVDIETKPDMDAVWCEWIGPRENWPQRACVGAELEGDTLVEIVVTAVR